MEEVNILSNNIPLTDHKLMFEEDLQNLMQKLLELKRELIYNLTKKGFSNRNANQNINREQQPIEEARMMREPDTDKSISTDASQEEIALDIIDNSENVILKNTNPIENFTNDNSMGSPLFCEETSYFCKKVEQALMILKRKLITGSQKIDLPFLMFLYDFLVVNHIDIKELDIFFGFIGSLIDARFKRIYLTERSFSRLLYEILLRLEFDSYNDKMYICLENCVLFLNVHLSILTIEPATDKITLHDKNILAMDAILEVYSKARESIVDIKASNFIIKILKAQIAYLDNNFSAARTLTYEQYFLMCKENLETAYEEDYQDLAKIERCVTNNLSLLLKVIEETDGYNLLNEESMRKEMIDQIVVNHTSIVPPVKFTLKVDLKSTINDLKCQICSHIGALEPAKIFLMSRGKILFKNDKILKDYGISAFQKIMLCEKKITDEGDAEMSCEYQLYENINSVLNIVPDTTEEFVQFVMEKLNNSIEETIIALTCEYDRKDWDVKHRAHLKEQDKKKRRENEEALMQTRQNTLKYMISCCGEFYGLIFKFQEFNNDNLETKVWQFLKAIPANQKIILNIKQAILGKDCSKPTSTELISNHKYPFNNDIKESLSTNQGCTKKDTQGGDKNIHSDEHNKTFNSMQDLMVFDHNSFDKKPENKNFETSSNPDDFLSINSPILHNDLFENKDNLGRKDSFGNDNIFDLNFGDNDKDVATEEIFHLEKEQDTKFKSHEKKNSFHEFKNEIQNDSFEIQNNSTDNIIVNEKNTDEVNIFSVDQKPDFPTNMSQTFDDLNIIRLRKKNFHPINDLLKNFSWKQMLENSSRNIILYEIEVLKSLLSFNSVEDIYMTEIHERNKLKESFITNGGLLACIKLMTSCSLPDTQQRITNIFLPFEQRVDYETQPNQEDTDNVNAEFIYNDNNNYVLTRASEINNYPDPRITKSLMRESNLMSAIIVLIKPFIHSLFLLKHSQNRNRLDKKATMRFLPFTLDKPARNYEENIFKNKMKSEQSEKEIKSVRSNQFFGISRGDLSPYSNTTPVFLSPNISREGSYKAPTPRGESVNQDKSENISISKSMIFTVTSKDSGITNEYSNFLKKLNTNKSLFNTIESIVDKELMIDFLFELLLKVVNFFLYVEGEDSKVKLQDLFKNIMELLIPCLQILREKKEILTKSFRKELLEKIYVSEKMPRSLQLQATTAFKYLITTEEDIKNSKGIILLNNDFLFTIVDLLKEGIEHNNGNMFELLNHCLFNKKSYSQIFNKDLNNQDANKITDIENEIIEEDELPENYHTFLANYCKDYIFNTDYKSDQIGKENKHLQGVVSQMINLIRQNYDEIYDENTYTDILKCLFSQLFDLENSPTTENQLDLKAIIHVKPRVLSPTSRKTIFDLISEIKSKDNHNTYKFHLLIFDLLASHFDRFTQDSTNNGCKDYDNSVYHSLPEFRKIGQFVGLRNLGATCYVNSFLQQLFMIESFRTNFLETTYEIEKCEENLKHNDKESQITVTNSMEKDADLSNAEITALNNQTVTTFNPNSNFDDRIHNSLCENLVYQHQLLYCNMQLGNKGYIAPKDFCKLFKAFGGPINTSVQQDVHEFSSLLFDEIERIIKFGNNSKLLDNIFGGKLCHQLVSLEYDKPFKSERDERFLSLSLGINDLRTLYDALDDYVKEEVMDEDNKYYCEEYDQKIEVMNKCALKSLPKILLITLKRFGYDNTTFQRIKLNDYFEFPQEIDMKRWTKDYIENVEETKKMLDENFEIYDGNEAYNNNEQTDEKNTDDFVTGRKSDSHSDLKEKFIDVETIIQNEKLIKTDNVNITNDSVTPPSEKKKDGDEKDELLYELTGVLVHSGTSEQGHYYSYIKIKNDDGSKSKWYEFNDTNVRPFELNNENIKNEWYGGKNSFETKTSDFVSEWQMEISRSAYMLFYEKVEKPELANLSNKNIMNEQDEKLKEPEIEDLSNKNIVNEQDSKLEEPESQELSNKNIVNERNEQLEQPKSQELSTKNIVNEHEDDLQQPLTDEKKDGYETSFEVKEDKNSEDIHNELKNETNSQTDLLLKGDEKLLPAAKPKIPLFFQQRIMKENRLFMQQKLFTEPLFQNFWDDFLRCFEMEPKIRFQENFLEESLYYDDKGELIKNKYINLIKHRSAKLLKKVAEINEMFYIFLNNNNTNIQNTNENPDYHVFGSTNLIIEGKDQNIDDVLMNRSFSINGDLQQNLNNSFKSFDLMQDNFSNKATKNVLDLSISDRGSQDSNKKTDNENVFGF